MEVVLKHSTDAERLNWLVNHPTITDGVRDDSNVGDLDLSPFLGPESPHIFLHIFVDGMEAGFFFLANFGAFYELHSGLLPEFRGRIALQCGREMQKWVFAHTYTNELRTWAWSTSKHVLLLAKVAGFSETSRNVHPVPVNGFLVERVSMTLTRCQWAEKHALLASETLSR